MVAGPGIMAGKWMEIGIFSKIMIDDTVWKCPECGYSNPIVTDRCLRCRIKNNDPINFLNFSEEDIE